MKNIAIFASGRGSNAAKIVDYFKEDDRVRINTIISNKKEAGVLDLALKNKIPSRVISRTGFYKTHNILEYLKDKQTDIIVLAGFLWLIPDYLITAYPQKIVNIHPALLPKYGGKGMYGHHVHKAVKEAGEKESGITIHYVNEHYDEGKHIAQFSTPLDGSMSADEIAQAVLKLEHEHLAPTIEKILFS